MAEEYVTQGLHWADYVVFGCFMLVSLGIGVYHAFAGGRQRTTKEFLSADKQLRIIPTMLSMLVSHQSAISVLGLPAEMYNYGIQAWICYAIFLTLAILISERFFVPWIYRMGLTSVYEYLELRYQSKSVRIFGALLGTLANLLYMGLAMFAPSLALEAATGFPFSLGIPIMAIVCTIYTTMGGLKAVIWTDVFQAGVMLAGILGVLIQGSIDVGGYDKAMDAFAKNGRLNWIDFNPDPRLRHTFWTFLIGFTMYWVYPYSFHQATVQRFCAIPTYRGARLSVLLNIPPLLLMLSLLFMIGPIAVAYFDGRGCDPLASKQIGNPNQMVITLMMLLLKSRHGFPGLFLATLYSGALSTVSSNLSASAAVVWEDILKPIPTFRKMSDSSATIVNKITVIAFGVLSTALSFLAMVATGPITQVTVAFLGAASGPIFGIFLMGGTVRKANWVGAWVGGIVAFGVNLWLSVGSLGIRGFNVPMPSLDMHNCPGNLTDVTPVPRQLDGIENFYGLSYLYFTPMGVILVYLFGVPASLIAGQFLSDIRPVPDWTMVSLKPALDCSCKEPAEIDDLPSIRTGYKYKAGVDNQAMSMSKADDGSKATVFNAQSAM